MNGTFTRIYLQDALSGGPGGPAGGAGRQLARSRANKWTKYADYFSIYINGIREPNGMKFVGLS